MSIDGRSVFNLGHLEYSKNTRHNEYIRDINKELATKTPKDCYTRLVISENIRLGWESTANKIFENRIKHYIYRKF